MIKERTIKKIQENENLGHHETTIHNRTYDVFPNVFSPNIFLGTLYLIDNLPYPQDGIFLEIGSGCGNTTIEGILYGKAKKAVAVDINEDAVKNTKYNINKFQLDN